MEIVVSGASGLVGVALVELLAAEGHKVKKLVRRAARDASEIQWDPAAGELDRAALDGADAVINLSGENVGEGRWTKERKVTILESRTKTTSLLAKAVAAMKPQPAYLCASAIGYYGPKRDEVADESAPKGDGFLAEVVEAWERASDPARQAGVRTTNMRLGVVLSKNGGALAKLLPVFKLGGGGPIGGGKQLMSWVSLADVVRSFHFTLNHPELTGPINVVAPKPVDNRTFTKTLASVLKRPAIIPVPAFALKAMFGQMAEETILASQNTVPKKLTDAGFVFEHETLEDLLHSELG